MIRTLTALVGTFIDALAGYFFYRLLASFLKVRKPLLLRLCGGFCLMIVVTIPAFPNDPVNITFALPLFILGIRLAFAEKWLPGLSMVMIFYPIIIALNYLWYDVTGRIFFRWFVMYGDNANHIFSTLSASVVPIFWYFVWQRYGKRLGRMRFFLDVRSWLLLDVICLASLASAFVCIYFTPEQSYKVYPSMIAGIVTGVGCLLLAAYLSERIRTEMEQRKLKLQHDYYKELERNQIQIRKLRHDMNNHLAVVGGLLEQENAKEAQEYLRQLSDHMETRNRIFCKNGIVNALLNLKYNGAMEAEIDTFFHISIDGLTGIDDISLCTLFANGLDNAIEACGKISDVKKRRLSLKARYSENGYFSFELVNSKSNPVHEKRGVFVTDKENQHMHGLGIASMKEIVEQYKGTIDIRYTKDEFAVVILIHVG